MSTLSHRIKRFSSVTPEDLRSVIGEAGGYTICFDITAVRFNPFVCVLTPAQFDSHAVTFTQGTRLWATFSDAGEVKDMDRPIFCKIQCQQAHDEPQAQDIGEASTHKATSSGSQTKKTKTKTTTIAQQTPQVKINIIPVSKRHKAFASLCLSFLATSSVATEIDAADQNTIESANKTSSAAASRPLPKIYTRSTSAARPSGIRKTKWKRFKSRWH
jgi:hypothetical protein